VLADAMYSFQLPPLAHDAVLTTFGAYGNASGASAKMALYADDGTGTRPAGAPLTQTSNPMGLVDGATEQSPSVNNVALTAGATYWVSFIANVATTLRSQAGTGKGWRVPSIGFANFPANPAPNPPGVTQNNINWALYIVVKDTD